MAFVDYDVIYVISYNDQVVYDADVALFGSNILYGVPPATGLPLFGLAYPPVQVRVNGKIAYATSYNISAPESIICFPNISGIPMDTTVATTIVPGQYPASGSPDGRFTWVLILQYQGGSAGTPGTPPVVPIPPRRWIAGAELPQNGEGASVVSGDFGLRVSRDASRTPEGFGYAWRNLAAGQGSLTFGVQTLGQPASPNSWERIYLRQRVRPTGDTTLWRCFGSSSPLSGMRLDVNSSGGLVVNRINAGGGATAIGTVGTIPMWPNWGRYDLLINFRTASAQGRFRIYQNGSLILDETIPNDNQGLGLAQNHDSSRIGNPDSASANDMEIDIDDWHNADIPNIGGTEILESRDWDNGSHIMRLAPDGDGGIVNWAGNWRQLLQNYLQLTQVALLQPLTSTTALAPIIVDLKAAPAWLTQLGGVAMTVGLFSSRVATDGQLGYNVPAVGAALSTIAQNALATWNSVLLNLPALTTEPADFNTGAQIEHTKGNSGSSSSVYSLQAVVEYIGSYGAEDSVNGNPAPALIVAGCHNAPYPDSRWVQGSNPPDNPFIVAGGIYSGDNLGQDILEELLPHWFWVRPLSGPNGGGHWWSSMMAGHVGQQTSPTPAIMPEASSDPATSTNAGKLRVAGANAQSNASGVTYQWIAIMDPAMRHVINDAFAANSNVASRTTPLVDDAFLPDVLMLQVETPGATTTNRFYYQGPGFAAQTAAQFDSAVIANIMSFLTGEITTLTAVHNASASQSAFSAIRAVDPNSCTTDIALVIGQYTGNGVGSRTLSINMGGRFPLFVLIVPVTNGQQPYFRDPSHTGANSSRADVIGALVTNAITAGGLDTVTIDTALNANGSVYSYFIIPGDVSGWNNGTFVLEPPCQAPCPPYCCDCIDPVTPPIPPDDCVDDWGTPRTDGLPYVPLMPEE